MPDKRKRRIVCDLHDEHLTRRESGQRGTWRDNHDWQFNAARASNLFIEIPRDSKRVEHNQDGNESKEEEDNNHPPSTNHDRQSDDRQMEVESVHLPAVSLNNDNEQRSEDGNAQHLDFNRDTDTDLHFQQVSYEEDPLRAEGIQSVSDFDLIHHTSSRSRDQLEEATVSVPVEDILERAVGHRISNLQEFCSKIFSMVKQNITRVSLTGLILLHGSVPLSCIQFNTISSLVDAFTTSLSPFLPSGVDRKCLQFMCGLSKVRKSIFPFIVKELVPKTSSFSTEAESKSLKPVEDCPTPLSIDLPTTLPAITQNYALAEDDEFQEENEDQPANQAQQFRVDNQSNRQGDTDQQSLQVDNQSNRQLVPRAPCATFGIRNCRLDRRTATPRRHTR